jgi:hypothetical protein
MDPGRAKPGARRRQDVLTISFGHRDSVGSGRCRGRGGSRGS